MKCAHCLENFHAVMREKWMGLVDADGAWGYQSTLCPACNKSTIWLQRSVEDPGGDSYVIDLQVWPKGIARSPVPKEVPEEFAVDYREACLVFADSPKASAALSRRCLQRLLREHVKVKPSNLLDEIGAVLASGQLSSHLANAIDAVRVVGNFAAHPLKSTNSGEIIDVEPGEADWLLDVLEGLFDFYFVQPARLAAKREALNKKLAEAGKPPIQ